MNRTGMSRALVGAIAAFVSAVALFAAVPARSITINDQGACSAWSWDGVSTLTCTPAIGGPPVCTVTGPTAGVVGTPVTLTASCAPAATSWLWSGGSCAGTTTSTCAATAAVTGNVSYTVAGTNANGPGVDSAARVVNWTNSLPPGPTGCTLTPSPSILAAAGTVNLTMTCGGGAPTSYTWSGATFSGGTSTSTNTNSATISATTAFTATASNGGGTAAAQASVQVGGGEVISCAAQGFSKTIVYNWNWGSSQGTIDSFNLSGGMGTNGILVVPFTPTGPEDGLYAALQVVGYPGTHNTTVKRTMAISTQPCVLYEKAPMITGTGATATLYYGMGALPFSDMAKLTPGVRYYINVALRSAVSSSSPSGTQTCVPGIANYPNCDVRLTVNKPAGH